MTLSANTILGLSNADWRLFTFIVRLLLVLIHEMSTNFFVYPITKNSTGWVWPVIRHYRILHGTWFFFKFVWVCVCSALFYTCPIDFWVCTGALFVITIVCFSIYVSTCNGQNSIWHEYICKYGLCSWPFLQKRRILKSYNIFICLELT